MSPFKKIIERLMPRAGLKRSLAECERRFDDVFDAATIGMAVVSLEGRIMRVNEAVCSMLGYSREELLVRNMMELTHSDDLAMDRECMQNLLSGVKQHCHFEKRYVRKGGVIIAVIMSAAIIRDQDGKPQYFVTQIEDISDRDRAEHELLWQLKVRDSIVELSKHLLAKSISVADISDLILEHAKRLTGSEFGFVGYIDPKTGYMIAPTLTRDIWEKCEMEGKSVVFKEFKGLWGCVLNNKKPVLCNDLKKDERSTGTPKGHVVIRRFLGVPVMVGDVLFGQIALANSPRDYVERDISIIERLANIYSVALQRRRDEDTLQENTVLLYTTLMSIGDAVVTTNAIGQVAFMNEVAQAITGWTLEMAMGHHVTEVIKIINQVTGERPESPVEKVLESGLPFKPQNHTTLMSRWGTMFSIDHNASPIKDTDGNITGVVFVFRDVTEARKIEEKLLMMRQTLEQSPSVVMITDKDGNIEYVNTKFVELTQYTLSEVIGKNPRILNPDECLPEQNTDMWKTLNDGGDWRGEFHNRRKDGTLYWEQARIFPIRNSAGETTNFVKVAEDMTQTRLLDKLKDEFISTISHELRTPLSITKEGIELVLDEIPGKINEKQCKILRTAKESAGRLARIINEVLDISRLESGDMVLYLENVCINRLVEKLTVAFKEQFLNKGLELNIELPSEDLYLNIDNNKITQVIASLIDNSLKFTSRGSVKISVEDNGDMVKCCVCDTGAGIAAEDFSNVFSKFRQFGRMPGAGDHGTGLGLAIAKGIVEMHQGTLTVESKAGEGSSFCFTLPKKA